MTFHAEQQKNSSSFQADNFQLKLNYFVIFLFFGSGIFVDWLRWILVDIMDGMERRRGVDKNGILRGFNDENLNLIFWMF